MNEEITFREGYRYGLIMAIETIESDPESALAQLQDILHNQFREEHLT